MFEGFQFEGNGGLWVLFLCHLLCSGLPHLTLDWLTGQEISMLSFEFHWVFILIFIELFGCMFTWARRGGVEATVVGSSDSQGAAGYTSFRSSTEHSSHLIG